MVPVQIHSVDKWFCAGLNAFICIEELSFRVIFYIIYLVLSVVGMLLFGYLQQDKTVYYVWIFPPHIGYACMHFQSQEFHVSVYRLF